LAAERKDCKRLNGKTPSATVQSGVGRKKKEKNQGHKKGTTTTLRIKRRGRTRKARELIRKARQESKKVGKLALCIKVGGNWGAIKTRNKQIG